MYKCKTNTEPKQRRDDVIVKKQKSGTNNMHDEDIDMISKPSYAHVMGEGEEKRNDHYWEAINVIANEALNEILPDDIEMVANIEGDEIVEVETLIHKHVPKTAKNLRCVQMCWSQDYLLLIIIERASSIGSGSVFGNKSRINIRIQLARSARQIGEPDSSGK